MNGQALREIDGDSHGNLAEASSKPTMVAQTLDQHTTSEDDVTTACSTLTNVSNPPDLYYHGSNRAETDLFAAIGSQFTPDNNAANTGMFAQRHASNMQHSWHNLPCDLQLPFRAHSPWNAMQRPRIYTHYMGGSHGSIDRTPRQSATLFDDDTLELDIEDLELLGYSGALT